MNARIPGIHHITTIAGDPQRNVDFYVRVLGLRLVKRTVNFDDPGTWHLYFGDGAGSPGTILTFFPWPGAPRGRAGAGEVSATAFAVPPGSLDFWSHRLARHGAEPLAWERRFDEPVLAFEDPDGTKLELVETAAAASRPAWAAGPVEARHAIRGFHSATLTVAASDRSIALLAGIMGFEQVAAEGPRVRYRAASSDAGSLVDVIEAPDLPPPRLGTGSVHHIAWRTPDDAGQAGWQDRLAAAGLHPTPVQDRQYFRSIYFREPGGILFEIATDPPGFARDEPMDALGTALKLPPWLEPMRGRIERELPPIQVPAFEPAK